MTASKPAIFNSGPKKPAASDSPAVPVSGDLPITLKRLDAAMGAPVMTPVAKTILFSGENGSIPGGTLFSR